MKDSESFDVHFRRIKEITDQLTAIRATIPEDEHMVALLLSLPRSYNTLVTALTARGDELNLTQLHEALISEEEKRRQTKSRYGDTDQGESALQHDKSNRKVIKCFGCGEENHIIRNCPHKKKEQHKVQQTQA